MGIGCRETWPAPGVSVNPAWPVVRDRVVIVVEARCDVEGYAGIPYHNCPRPEPKRHPIGGHKIQPMAPIVVRVPTLVAQVVIIRRQSGEPSDITRGQ